MRYFIGKYVLDIDVARTRAYYEAAQDFSCTCTGCRNFAQAVRYLPDEVKAFFERLGMDMKKPAEVFAIYKNGDHSVYYGGFFHICGTILEGPNTLVQIDEKHSTVDKTAVCSLSDVFEFYFQEECYLLDEQFPRPVFQMEVYMTLPWVLQGVECDY